MDKNEFINIKTEFVSIHTNRAYKIIEINYTGIMKITPLVNKFYKITNNNNKILIMYLGKENKRNLRLFKYTGTARIINCRTVDKNFISKYLYIKRNDIQLWNTLIKPLDEDGDGPIYDSMTRNWEDIDFDGNNNKSKRIHRKTTYNKETRTYTTTKEIRKK